MATELLYNRKSPELLKAELAAEPFERRLASFYRYQTVQDPQSLRDELYRSWSALGVLGRIYLATEGINAQFSVPLPKWEAFVDLLQQWPLTRDIFINVSAHYQQQPFWKLKIKVRKQIVADGLDHGLLQQHQRAPHLAPLQFHQAIQDPSAIVVDTRNQYECETGHFDGALLPKSERFSEVLPELNERLKDHKASPILLYCTGGIRCEKTSAYLRGQGFKNVAQLQGGIIHYLKQVTAAGLTSKYRGSLFVFDGRMAEPAVVETLGRCYQCQSPYDVHRDCANDTCHRLMIQCPDCSKRLRGCCGEACLNQFNRIEQQ